LRLSVSLRANGDIPARGAAKRAILWKEVGHDPVVSRASQISFPHRLGDGLRDEEEKGRVL
jgi:hypothetical protein